MLAEPNDNRFGNPIAAYVKYMHANLVRRYGLAWLHSTVVSGWPIALYIEPFPFDQLRFAPLSSPAPVSSLLGQPDKQDLCYRSSRQSVFLLCYSSRTVKHYPHVYIRTQEYGSAHAVQRLFERKAVPIYPSLSNELAKKACQIGPQRTGPKTVPRRAIILGNKCGDSSGLVACTRALFA